jgi:hypothetical protein
MHAALAGKLARLCHLSNEARRRLNKRSWSEDDKVQHKANQAEREAIERAVLGADYIDVKEFE